MADAIFYIEGKSKNIFNVGFRPALMGKAAELGLKSAASNIPDTNKIEVLVSGSQLTIESFHKLVQTSDLRIKSLSPSSYNVSGLSPYNGPNIDWSGYQLSLMTEQMYKGFLEANKRSTNIEESLKKNSNQKNMKT